MTAPLLLPAALHLEWSGFLDARRRPWNQQRAFAAAQVEKPIPVPKPGEVLVRMLARPVNPGDIFACQGMFEATIKAPITPGTEGPPPPPTPLATPPYPTLSTPTHIHAQQREGCTAAPDATVQYWSTAWYGPGKTLEAPQPVAACHVVCGALWHMRWPVHSLHLRSV